MPKLFAVFALALFTAVGGCKGKEINAPEVGSGDRILFIGNSYLYTQNIPAVVQAMAAANGVVVRTVSVAGPDMALHDHLSTGDAVAAIAQGNWKYIVLQQGPSAVWYNRDSLRAATAIFDNLARQVQAKTALFSAWPQQQHSPDFPHAIESYRLAAQDVNGVFMPVATAWLKAWEYDQNLRLYEDGLHPSPEGAYLAALVVYATLFNKTPLGMPASIGGLNLTESDAAILQVAAANVTGFEALSNWK